MTEYGGPLLFLIGAPGAGKSAWARHGWLRRERLVEACRRLSAGDEPGVWDLLEPFEDEAAVRRG